MGRKYNYFDDNDPVVQGKVEKSKLKNAIAFFKYIFVVALFTIKDFIKRRRANVTGTTKVTTENGERIVVEKSPARLVVRMIIVTICVIAILVSSFFISINKENKRETRFNQEAYKICSQYNDTYGICNYKSLSSEYDVQGYILTGLCYVREIDFNADSESELLLIYNLNDEFFAEIWGFHSKDFVKLYEQKISYSKNFNDDIWFTLYLDGQKNYVAQHDSEDLSKVDILRLAGDKFAHKKSAKYDVVNQTYSIHDKDETTSFERIKMSALKSYNASMITDQVYDTVDGFITNDVKKNEPTTSVSKPNDIKSAYFSIVEKYNEEYGKANVLSSGSMSYIDGLASVQLIDFNGDGTNEMVLLYRKSVISRTEDNKGNMVTTETPEYFCEIYGWKNNNAMLIYQSEGISNKLNSTDSRYFITKINGKERYLCTNKFVVEDYGRTVDATSRIMKLEDGSFVTDMKAEYQTRYGYTDYYLNGKYTYKSSFEYNGGFSVPFFNGYDADINTALWDIVYTQLPGSERSKLEEQVKKTIKTIQKLDESYNSTNE